MLMLKYEPKMYECTCCRNVKAETEFYRQSYTGLRDQQCKECVNIKRSVQRRKADHGKFVSKEKLRHIVDTIDYSFEDWRDAMLHFRGACAWCGKKEGRSRKDKLERDHVVPVSLGGKTIRTNIVPSCCKCNRGRGNRDWESWYKAQSFYSRQGEERIRQWIKGEAVQHG